MNKTEYLIELRQKLAEYNFELQKEIIEDYEAHFAEGIAAGKSEDEIIAELGDIEDMIEEFTEEERKQSPAVTPHASGHREQESTKESSGMSAGRASVIELNTLLADVHVKKSSDDRIYVEYQNNGDEMCQLQYRFYQYEENGVFYAGITQTMDANENCGDTRMKLEMFGKTFFSFGKRLISGSEDIQISLSVPAGFPKLSIVGTSGDIDFEEVQMQDIIVVTGSGDVRFENTDTHQICVKTGSGDIEFEQIHTEELVTETGSGDVDLQEAEATIVTAKTGSGDIYGEQMQAYSISAMTGSGDIELECMCKIYAISTGSGEIEIEEHGEPEQVKIRTGSGDVEFHTTNEIRATVTAKTGSGDIEVVLGNERHEIHGGKGVFGDGPCAVEVKTGSGDAEIVLGI